MRPGQHIDYATTKLYRAAAELAIMVQHKQISAKMLDLTINYVEDALAHMKEARKGKAS